MVLPFDDIGFFAQFSNCVEVLESCPAAPHAHHELVERSEILQADVEATHNKLETHHYAVWRGQNYEITPLGELVVGKFTDPVEVVASQANLPVDSVRFASKTEYSGGVT